MGTFRSLDYWGQQWVSIGVFSDLLLFGQQPVVPIYLNILIQQVGVDRHFQGGIVWAIGYWR